MTESINLDSADMVESLEFDPLGDSNLEGDLELGLDPREQIAGNEMDVATEALLKDEIDVKEEVVDNLEEEEIMEETVTYDESGLDNHVIDSVMDIVEEQTYNDGQSTLSVDANDSTVIQSNNEMFSESIIGEEIVTDEQIIIDGESHIYEDREFQDMMNDTINEETVIDSTEVMECEKPDGDGKALEQCKIINSSEVYFVTPQTVTSQSIIQTNNIIAPKDTKVSRLLVPNAQGHLTEGQTIRLVASQGKVVTTSPKTITLTQAKQMGLLNFNQIITPATSKGGVSKLVVPKKTVTVMKSSPTKILPAPPGRSQKVVIRSPGGGLKAGTLLTTSTSPVLRIPATQATQLHLPTTNKQVQFVKLVGGNKGGTTLVPVQTISTKPIPVALPTSLLNSQQTFKVVPVVSQAATSGQTQGQRVLIPASTTQVVSSVQPNTQRHSIVMLQPQLLSPLKEGHVIEESVATTEVHTTYPGDDSGVGNQRSTANGKRASAPKKEEKSIEIKSDPEADVIEANGIRPRKPCNCTKSMCLKLYCDCFANGEFCHQCNCTTCYNNLQHEEERQRAIKSCLERNPTAFRPKIGKTYVGSEERRHNKGCNCRRSGCLKNYCECYEAKIPCSKNCKCVGCKNTDAFLKRGLSVGGEDDKFGCREKADGLATPRNSFDSHIISTHRQVLNYMSPQLMEATCECLVAQVEEWSRAGSTDLDLAQALVIEELGRCLAQLIECINKSIAQIPQPSTAS